MRLYLPLFTATCVLALMFRVAIAEDSSSESLASQLENKATESAKRFSPNLLRTMKEAISSVQSTGIEESAKQVGDTAIDAQLMGWNGQQVQLSKLWSEGPIILMWYRGGWCPYCNLQLRAMQQKLEKIEEANAKLVVLTPELPEYAKETAEANDLDFVALHDKNNDVARSYGIVFPLPKSLIPTYRNRLKLDKVNGNDEMELPLSATYVIDTEGLIRYAFLDADYKKRAEPAEVLSVIRRLSASPSP